MKILKDLTVIDERDNSAVFVGGKITVSYTLQWDDISLQERTGEKTTPYQSRQADLTFDRAEENTLFFKNAKLCVTLQITALKEGVCLLLHNNNEDISEFGINLPFNFMGKLNGGGYKNQFLFNGPYRSQNNEHKFCYLENLNGNDLVVIFESEADGWKMDYSPYVGGHYFINLKCLANFDKIYNTNSKIHALKIGVYPIHGFDEALQKAVEVLNVPAIYFEKSYTFNGKGSLKVLGDCDEVWMYPEEGEVRRFEVNNRTVDYIGAKGRTRFIPVKDNKKGMDCVVYAYEDLEFLHKLSCDSIISYQGIENLGNLCECQFWALSMLKYMLKHGRKKEYDERLKKFFAILMPEKEEDAVVRLSVLPQENNGFPKYSVYKSRRIQEHFAGISIFLDAYKLYKKEIYLEYAKGMLDSLIENYQTEKGNFATAHGGKVEDYSTVTCLIFPIVDMANYFKDKNEQLYRKYKESAAQLAEFIYKRGFSFPTEGGESDLAEEQMEDGSISCTALTLLYYCANVERKEEYIAFSKEILELHESWTVKTPHANAYRSSLRWWETRWEGDKDGPALCLGHSWTIWRAEADFWYWYLTGEKEYLQKSLNSFTTNIAKGDKFGRYKAVYQMDYITGGGFLVEKVQFRIAPEFPDLEDVKTSRYVWARASETILKLAQKDLV